jgi:hypothetical protein
VHVVEWALEIVKLNKIDPKQFKQIFDAKTAEIEVRQWILDEIKKVLK